MKRKKKPKTAITPRRVSARILRPLVLACLTLFLTINSSLQGTEQPKPAAYALIFGTVWGPDDRPMYGVEVKIRVAGEKKARWAVHSNHLGEFEQRIPGGEAGLRALG